MIQPLVLACTNVLYYPRVFFEGADLRSADALAPRKAFQRLRLKHVERHVSLLQPLAFLYPRDTMRP